MVEVNDLCLSYGEKIILENLNATFKSGEIKGIIGYNGVGKTSLFNCLCGMLTPNAGEIKYQDVPLTIQNVLYLEAENYFYPQLTGKEFLNIIPDFNPAFNATDLAKLFKLDLNELIDFYSTGMKKKLIMLLLLKTNKPIIILDEPFNGLDLETHQLLEIILKQLKKQGKIIILASHIIEPLVSICDSILFLNDKQFRKEIKNATVAEIKEQLISAELTEIESKLINFL